MSSASGRVFLAAPSLRTHGRSEALAMVLRQEATAPS